MKADRSIIYQRVLFVVFWIFCTFGFVADEIFPPLHEARTIVYLLIDAVLVVLGLLTINWRDKWQVIVIGSFLLVSVFTSIIVNKSGIVFYVNGCRDFITVTLFYPIFKYFMSEEERRARFIHTFNRTIYIFLWIQLFCVTFQMFKYGAGDHGGGSFGNLYSGIVSLDIYIGSFYLMEKRIDRSDFFRSLWDNKVLIFLLIPTFLNETKISFVLFILYFVLLMPIDRKMFVRSLIIVPIMSALLYVGYVAYTSSQNDIHFEATEDFLVEYMTYDLEDAEGGAEWDIDNNGTTDVPRFTKFLLMALVNEEQPGHIPYGFGVGLYKGGTVLTANAFYDRYEWLLLGTTPYALHIYLQMGLMGLIWIFFTFWVWFTKPPKNRPRRNTNMQLFLLACLVLILFYNDCFRAQEFVFFFMGTLQVSWLKPKAGEESQMVAEN